MKVIFFGTPEFAADLLEYLLQNGIEVAAVVTKPDRPQGRSKQPVASPVKEAALRNNLPIFQPPIVSAPEFAPTLEALQAELFVVVAYGEIMKQHLLDMPTHGCINVHASLLPKYRGAAPIQHSILAGEKETGVTIMQMVKKMDAGDIIVTAKVPIDTETTYGELTKALCAASQKPLLEVIKTYAQGIVPAHTAQDHTLATYAPKVELEDCQIDWNKDANTLHNLIRGVNPDPGAWCYVEFNGERKRLKITRSLPVAGVTDSPPAAILHCDRQGLIINCHSGALKLLELQLEGKRKMTADEFVRGLGHSDLKFF